MILIVQMILLSRQNKNYEATKKAMLIDCARYRIMLERRYIVYNYDIEKYFKEMISLCQKKYHLK